MTSYSRVHDCAWRLLVDWCSRSQVWQGLPPAIGTHTRPLRVLVLHGSGALPEKRELLLIIIIMQVKQQCYILGASVLVPVTIMVMGFNLFSAVLGVLFYIGFLIYSLQRGEPSRPEEEKDEDIEAISTPLSLSLSFSVSGLSVSRQLLLIWQRLCVWSIGDGASRGGR